MLCPLCSHDKTYKHGKTSKGSQRYRCLLCKQTFTNTFDTIYYRRQVSEEEVRIVLQAHCEGTSLRGISRTLRSILQYWSQPDSSGKSKSPASS